MTPLRSGQRAVVFKGAVVGDGFRVITLIQTTCTADLKRASVDGDCLGSRVNSLAELVRDTVPAPFLIISPQLH